VAAYAIMALGRDIDIDARKEREKAWGERQL